MYFPGFSFRGAKFQKFSFVGNHGPISDRHWIHYKLPVLGTVGVGTYAYAQYFQY